MTHLLTETSLPGDNPGRPTRWNRLRLASGLTFRLRNLKAKTGLTPNILCRLGFSLSLAEPYVPDPDVYDEDGQEFNRSTLVGEWEDLFDALLRQRLIQDGLDVEKDFMLQLRAHMNRGAELICNRVHDLGDILALVPGEDTQ